MIIEKKDQLVEYFLAGGKPRSMWRIGTEFEKIAINCDDGSAIPYFGKRGVEAILRKLVDQFGWQPKFEEGHIIALDRGSGSITLEPGGQIELSGEQCESIHCTQREFSEHIREIVAATETMGIAFLGLGMQPFSPLEKIDWVPKKRYQIMAPYMLRVGSLGQRMMKQTATVQANVDYADEQDAMAKFRVAMAITPIVSAIFANSPISDGGPNGYMTLRGHIWTDTDRQRCGLLPFAFKRDVGFEDYVDYALSVPVYFIIREGQWIDLTGIPFRKFLAEGCRGERATIQDWALHLSTLFPEVRFKTYLEIRSADSQPPELMLALPALIKGLLYEDDCLLAAWDLVKSWKWEERRELYHDAHRLALKAKIKRIRLIELAAELVSIAAVGLNRQKQLDENGRDETIYLERLQEQVGSGRSSADFILERWQGIFGKDLAMLIENSAYRV
jgi:glutamate--cysteine ligase